MSWVWGLSLKFVLHCWSPVWSQKHCPFFSFSAECVDLLCLLATLTYLQAPNGWACLTTSMLCADSICLNVSLVHHLKLCWFKSFETLSVICVVQLISDNFREQKAFSVHVVWAAVLGSRSPLKSGSCRPCVPVSQSHVGLQFVSAIDLPVRALKSGFLCVCVYAFFYNILGNNMNLLLTAFSLFSKACVIH